MARQGKARQSNERNLSCVEVELELEVEVEVEVGPIMSWPIAVGSFAGYSTKGLATNLYHVRS
jgi:hypothetical protein